VMLSDYWGFVLVFYELRDCFFFFLDELLRDCFVLGILYISLLLCI
jgi:hypothetical protein